MAKIPTYPALTSPNNNDLLIIEDSVASATKKITRANFLSGTALPANTVDAQAISSSAVTTAKINAGAVTAAKLATTPSRFVILSPAIQIQGSTDPANTNWTSLDITSSTSATTTAALITMVMSSGGGGLYKGHVRPTGSGVAQSELTAVVSNPSLTGPFYGTTAVALDASQSFDWSVSNAGVTEIIIILRGYWETVA